MSSPVHTESRNFTSFLSLSSFIFISDSLESASSFNSKQLPRHVSQVKRISSFHTIILVLVLILDLQQANFAEGALRIKENQSSGQRIISERKIAQTPAVHKFIEKRNNFITKKYEAAEATTPYYKNSYDHTVEHETLTEFNVGERKNINGYEAIIHEESVLFHPPREKTALPELDPIFLEGNFRGREIVDNYTTDKLTIFRSMREKRIARIETALALSRESSLEVTDNTNNTELDDEFVSRENWLQKSTYKPPLGSDTPPEKYDRRHFGPPRVANIEDVSEETSKVTIIPTTPELELTVADDKKTKYIESTIFTSLDWPRLMREKRFPDEIKTTVAVSKDINISKDIVIGNSNNDVTVSSVNDELVRTEKSPAVKSTYKPAALGTPLEKYDRRHFGPPRVENVEEASLETSEATSSTGSSSPEAEASYTFTSSFHSSGFSSSTFSSSTLSLLPNLANASEADVNGTRAVNHFGNTVVVDDESTVHQREPSSSPMPREVQDNKPDGNEEHANPIDSHILDDNRAHEQPQISNDDSTQLPQSSSAISKLFEHEQPHDIATATTILTSSNSYELVDKIEVTILGLFELTQGTEARPEGPSELQAARLAVDRVNDMNVLPNIHLRLIHNDTREEARNTIYRLNELTSHRTLHLLRHFKIMTKAISVGPGYQSMVNIAPKVLYKALNICGFWREVELLPFDLSEEALHTIMIELHLQCDPGVAVDRFFHALYTAKNTSVMPLLLGTACSEVTETLAKIAPYWNIVQVSFGSTAPALSDPTEFPLFVRTVAPDSSHNPARISLIKHFGWDTVTALSQNGDMYSLAVNDLVTELEQANITCTATITFGENDYKEQLRTLKDLDTRIIIGSFSPALAPQLFCEAWKLGMHGGDYAWILPGETIDLSGMTGDWWHSGAEDCSLAQLSQTLDGLIIVKSYGTGLTEERSDSGLTTAKFASELAKKGVTLSRLAGQTFDAVWSMALALRELEDFLNARNSSISQYNHSRKDIAYRLMEELKALNFRGVSGPVSFDGADRVGITAFYQMHGHAIRRIALYTPQNGELTMNCAGCARARWPGEQPPVARRVFRFRMVTIDYAAFLAVTCLASVGVTLALSFLAFNLHFRKHKNIKLSSPRLNNMAAVGCVLVYTAVILLGLDHATLADSDEYFPTICTARAYLLSAGFSMAFGSMFTKTYRVHRIFTRSRSGVVKNKLLQDTQLISLICVLLLIDGLLVTLWVTLDPMQRDLRNLTLEISSEDRAVIYQPQVEVCRSQNTNGWLAALYVYKGLLLIVGVYMAWETRHVKIPALNDSQYIGMSVYSVVITSGIVVVLANLMSDRATLSFVTITTLILASTTATLALLFLPQLANILAGERADPVVHSLGLKIECNTRRFVTDDSRELQYRVEVQNRVYRREMAQLELELARLEKQLGQEPVEPSHASSSASIPQRNPSIGGGLPLLLLSVLPPVIPRASWPSADPSGMRRGTVAFSSQPDLEPDGPRRSLADIYKLQWRRDTEGPSRLGVFQRLFSLFGSRPTSRKTSTASFTGVASALRVHMGYIAGLVPGTKASSSSQLNVQGIRQPHPRCGSGPIISITSDEDRRLSLGLRRKESSEPRVNFSLPSKSNASHSSSREKIRGSPRFPHRIVPANSMNAIVPGSMTSAHQRWHSMEDASKQKIVGGTQRGSTFSANFDVWAFRERAIPLSEFDNRTRDSLALTIPTDSISSPDDALLGSDLRKLFRENSLTPTGSEDGNSLDEILKITTLIESSCNSPIKKNYLDTTVQIESRSTRTSNTNDFVNDIQVTVDDDTNHSDLSLITVQPELLSNTDELLTDETEKLDEESSGPCED